MLSRPVRRPIDGGGASGLACCSLGPARSTREEGETLRSRAEIMKTLRESYEYGAWVWAGLTEEKTLEMVPGKDGQQTSAGRPFSE